MIKIEVQEKEGFNTLIITPRSDDEESRKQMDLIFHAIMTTQEKSGGMVMGKNFMQINVRKADLIQT